MIAPARRFARGACLCGLLLGLAALVGAGEKPHWHSASYLVDSFVEIALRNEHDAKVGMVRKWITPIRYHLVHHAPERELHERLLRTHFAHLAELTGLAIGPAENAAQANFTVVLGGEETLKADLLQHFGWRSAQRREQFFREAICLGVFKSGKDGRIVGAAIIIPVDRARARRALVNCVVEELTQVMGLPNDSEKVFPSVFNDRSTDVYLSGLDVLLLKMLYDPRLKPGMDAQAARPVLETLAAEIERANGFVAAEKAAFGGGLSGLDP